MSEEQMVTPEKIAYWERRLMAVAEALGAPYGVIQAIDGDLRVNLASRFDGEYCRGYADGLAVRQRRYKGRKIAKTAG